MPRNNSSRIPPPVRLKPLPKFPPQRLSLPRSPRILHLNPRDIDVRTAPMIQVHVLDFLPLRLVHPLEDPEDYWEQHKQDIRVNERSGLEGCQCSPTLDQRQEYVGPEPEPGIVRVQPGAVGEIFDATSLDGPGATEADVDEGDCAPDEEGRHARQIDDVGVGIGGSGGDVHHGQRAKEVGEDDGGSGDAALVGLAKDGGGFAVLRHKEHCTATDVDGGVDGGQACDENEGVDEMDTTIPAGVLDGDTHWRLEGARGLRELRRVGGAREPEEESAAHVDEEDAPEDLADRERHGDGRVLGLCRSNSDGLAASVKGSAENEDGCDAAEAVRECAWVMPVPETEGFCLSLQPSRRIDDGEDEVGDQARELDKREPELSLPKSLHPEQLEAEEEEPEEQEVAPQWDLVTPEVEYGADGIVLVCQHGGPNDKIIPADCGAEGPVDKAVRELGECTTAGIQCRHLAQRLHDAEGDEADDAKADQQRRRTSLV
ncbi:hypothetical protein V496_09890 [Pseudogymnoascus sp. VKM F-4515 (FW-2607)]|nr:hypothetical protein V496_09890 [Pseudogymnoascus sp. VKM F-4515 (FW-2607)]